MVMDVHRLADPGLGNSAWLVDLGDGSALVVDPSRDLRNVLEETGKRGLRIRWVAETHLHADFVSGARELVSLFPDATFFAPAQAELDHPHEPVAEGVEVDLGGLTLRPVATPGHTPEHLAYLLLDGDRPQALFSGGTLIVDGVARPDLLSPELTEPLARDAWRSITERLLTLPEDLDVYPTHGGGSFCSAGSPDRAVTTIGEQRAANPLLQAGDEDAFVQRLLQGLGSFPPYFLKLPEVNRGGPRRYGRQTPTLPRLDPDEVERRVAAGARVIDVRPIGEYAAGHVPGSLSIELRGQFATWLGWLVEDLTAPLVFIVGETQDRDDLVRQCLKIGYENLAGELAGGVEAWRATGREIAATQLTDTPPIDRTVVDVRQRSEWETGHIPDAVHVELGDVTSAADKLPNDRLITHCVHGQRSTTAASILEQAGRPDVAVFTGGPDEWGSARQSES
ncbi:MAG: rhodanese-like domain-containing protein [Actinomycetota bacterium]|nr:rhodanese-like domain-containing protein [Actinomycetota bacterium]